MGVVLAWSSTQLRNRVSCSWLSRHFRLVGVLPSRAVSVSTVSYFRKASDSLKKCDVPQRPLLQSNSINHVCVDTPSRASVNTSLVLTLSLMASASWETSVKKKRAALRAAIPSEWHLPALPTPTECPNVVSWPRQVLSEHEVIITETSALAILANIHAQIWSAEEVTRAFCHRAAVAHQLVNCLTEVLFDEAILKAQKLDQSYQASGCLQGPLHGLPMSFMDRFRIAGVETSSGFVSWLGPIESAEAEGSLLKHLRALGAIPICKTNVPQSMMLGNTTNNIFGSTLNPFNRHFSAGGAAGGTYGAPLLHLLC